MRAGACGYLLKRSTPEQIIAAIRDVQQGGAPMSSEIARKVISQFREPLETSEEVETLSTREREVLELVAQGLDNKAIAGRLGVSVDAVRWHLKHIYLKLHVRREPSPHSNSARARRSNRRRRRLKNSSFEELGRKHVDDILRCDFGSHRVAVVEENLTVREGLQTIINLSPGCQCVGAWSTTNQTLAMLPTQDLNVILIDLELAVMGDGDFAARVKKHQQSASHYPAHSL